MKQQTINELKCISTQTIPARMHEHIDDEDNENIKHNKDEVPDNIIAISVTGAPDTHLLQLIFRSLSHYPRQCSCYYYYHPTKVTVFCLK